MSTVIVRMQVKPECEQEFLRIFGKVAAVVEADEDDATIYAVWRTARPQEYLLVESYRSEAGRKGMKMRMQT